MYLFYQFKLIEISFFMSITFCDNIKLSKKAMARVLVFFLYTIYILYVIYLNNSKISIV